MAKLQPDYISWTLSLNAGGLQKEIHSIKQNSKELKEENRDLKKSMQDLILQGKYQGTEYNKLNAQYKENNRLISENTAKIRQCESQLSNVNKSYAQLSRQAKQLQRDLDDTVQSLEPEEYARLEKELLATKEAMAKLKGKTDETQESFNSLTKTEAVILGFFASIGHKIMSYLDNIIQKTRDYITEGNEMAKTSDGIKRAFDRLDRPGLLNNLQKSTKNTVNDLELMKNAVQADQFRIPLQDLGKYLQFAQMRAQDAGQSVEYMTNSIVTGLGRKSVMILDNLGLSAAEINEEVGKTGDFMQAVANIVDRELKKAGENYVTSADRSIQKTVKLQNEQRKLGEILLPIMEKWETFSGRIEVGTVKLIAWLVKHKNTVVTLTAAIVTYITAKKLATMWEGKYGTATLASVAAEKLKTMQLALSRKALLAKLIVMDLYRGRCNLATAATEMFNLVLGANKLALFATVLITAATALAVFRNNNSLATKSVDDLNKRLVTERINLNNIFEELKKTNPGTLERTTLIDTLNEKYPGLIANYDLEKAGLQEITRAQNEANEALTKRIATEMKGEALQKIMTKNATTQVNTTKNIIKAFKDTLEPGVFEGMEKELQDFLADASTSVEDMEEKFNHLFTRPFSGTNSRIVRSSFKMLRDNQKSLAADIETVNKAYEPFLKTLKTAGPLTDEELKKQVMASSIIQKLEREKKKVQDTWKEDTTKNILLKNKEIERLDEEIKKYRELGKIKPKDSYQSEIEKELTALDNKHAQEVLKIKEKKEKEELTEAQYNQLILQEDKRYYQERLAKLEELEKKTSAAKKKTWDDIQKKTIEGNTKLLETERKMDENEITLLQEQRDKRLEEQDAVYKAEKTALDYQYANQQITKQAHDLLIFSLEEKNSENRLAILRDYQDDVKGLELNFGKVQADAVKKAGQEVQNAELANAKDRAKLQKTIDSLLPDFKKEFSLTNLPDETDLQLKVLEASYQARKELAKKYGKDTTELTQAYETAKLNILRDAEARKASIQDKYGLQNWNGRLKMQMDALRREKEQGLISNADYARAEKNLKMTSWKEAFDYYSNLFGDAFAALQNAEIANMEAKYDVEIEAARGNADEVERLEQEKAEKKLEIEKKYADVQFAVKASQIIASTAMAIMMALAQLGPIAGPIAAALMGVTGAAQLAAANAERQKVKNMSLTNTGSSSGSAERVVNGSGYSEGGYTGDGERYEVAGVVHRGEYVVPMPEMKDKRVINAVKVIESVRRQRTGANPMPGYAEGGHVGKPTSGPSGSGAEKELKEASDKLLKASENLNKPQKSFVVLSEINAAQELQNKFDDPFTRGDNKNGNNN